MKSNLLLSSMDELFVNVVNNINTDSASFDSAHSAGLYCFKPEFVNEWESLFINEYPVLVFLNKIFSFVKEKNLTLQDLFFNNNMLKELAGILQHHNSIKEKDADIIILNIKQLIILFNNSNLKTNTRPAGTKFNYIEIYKELMISFWTKTSWEKLFVSIPEYAKKLSSHKKNIIGLLLDQKSDFKIDTFAENLTNTLNLEIPNDLFFTSFIDFYIFGWLLLFNLIVYMPGDEKDAVKVKLTSNGRHILKNINKII